MRKIQLEANLERAKDRRTFIRHADDKKDGESIASNKDLKEIHKRNSLL